MRGHTLWLGIAVCNSFTDHELVKNVELSEFCLLLASNVHANC